MKTPALLLLSLLAFTGCSHETSKAPAALESSGREHGFAATYTSEPFGIYRIVDGVATVVDQEPTDLEQLGRVKILGAVQRPGLYCFSRSVPLEDIVLSAGPFLAHPRYAHTCASAGPADHPFETIRLNFIKYMQRDGKALHEKRILLKGGVVFIPEWF